MSHDVFISYSSHNKSVADAICAKLEADMIRCWIAPRDVLPGTVYAAALIDGISGAKAFVLVLSEHSNSSQQVLREVERAVDLALPIVTFRIEEFALSKAMQFFVSTSQWLDALTPPLALHIGRLSNTVKALLSASSKSVAPVSNEQHEKREFSASDEETLRELYACFDRPAFRMTFEHETDLEALMVALDDTIAAINTGVKRRRDGVVFGHAVKGKPYFESNHLRDSFDRVVMLLTEAKSVYEEAVHSGCFFDLDSYLVFSLEGRPPIQQNAAGSPHRRRQIAFHASHQDAAIAAALKIDELRNQVLAVANSVYARLGMRAFPCIETPRWYLERVKKTEDS
jgi:hypothetical protein